MYNKQFAGRTPGRGRAGPSPGPRIGWTPGPSQSRTPSPARPTVREGVRGVLFPTPFQTPPPSPFDQIVEEILTEFETYKHHPSKDGYKKLDNLIRKGYNRARVVGLDDTSNDKYQYMHTLRARFNNLDRSGESRRSSMPATPETPTVVHRYAANAAAAAAASEAAAASVNPQADPSPQCSEVKDGGGDNVVDEGDVLMEGEGRSPPRSNPYTNEVNAFDRSQRDRWNAGIEGRGKYQAGEHSGRNEAPSQRFYTLADDPPALDPAAASEPATAVPQNQSTAESAGSNEPAVAAFGLDIGSQIEQQEQPANGGPAGEDDRLDLNAENRRVGEQQARQRQQGIEEAQEQGVPPPNFNRRLVPRVVKRTLEMPQVTDTYHGRYDRGTMQPYTHLAAMPYGIRIYTAQTLQQVQAKNAKRKRQGYIMYDELEKKWTEIKKKDLPTSAGAQESALFANIAKRRRLSENAGGAEAVITHAAREARDQADAASASASHNPGAAVTNMNAMNRGAASSYVGTR